MTIFDVIRYPISAVPNAEEFHRLPPEIYRTWIDHPGNTWSTIDEVSRYDADWVGNWVESHLFTNHSSDLSTQIEKELVLLRRIILEWNV